MKPHWENIHDWWMEDLAFEYSQRREVLEMIKRHPSMDDSVGNTLRDILKDLDKHIQKLRKEYKKIYGTFPKK